MEWIVTEEGFSEDNIDFFGSKFLTGNGYMGYRGTLEEFTKSRFTACTLADCYDQNGDKWREPVNAPNPFRIIASVNEAPLDVIKTPSAAHKQSVNLKSAMHIRETTFILENQKAVVKANRFISQDNLHLMVLRYSVTLEKDAQLSIEAIIDTDIWDLNGPHLYGFTENQVDGVTVCTAHTGQSKRQIAVAQAVTLDVGNHRMENSMLLDVKAGEPVVLTVYATVYKDGDSIQDESLLGDSSRGDIKQAAANCVISAKNDGFDVLLDRHKARWESIWRDTNVTIKGDDAADIAVRYSLYLLMVSTPGHTSNVAVPARGLSGQIYKGAMFWDTEIFMLPFYAYTRPEIARNLVMYRVKALDGAKRKALEYGYTGAFYAWESQDTGDDACTLYSFNDVFTGRPMRTFFRDKQIHISADVMYGISLYYTLTGDDSLLWDGGIEVMLECARFLYQYSYYKPQKDRYELPDVTCADEYHERVNNNAYTNTITKAMLEKMFDLLEHLRSADAETLDEILRKTGVINELDEIRLFAEKLYTPAPDDNGIIEQFDGFFNLEDVPIETMLARKLRDDEYLGGANGLAAHTQNIKQADVVLANVLLPERYTSEERSANYYYYEPRTEHGSTLSACIHSLAAADCGDIEKAYNYFMKTAQVDLFGQYKKYVGGIFIGGTHAAANGGAWMAAVMGLAGIRAGEHGISISPRLPGHWESIEIPLCLRGASFLITVGNKDVIVNAGNDNPIQVAFTVFGESRRISAGETRTFNK